MTDPTLTTALNGVLQQTVSRPGGVPGVVAMATDRNANFYEGAAGVRRLGGDDPMATDSVFAIFSTTKALTGTCVMQLVEGGRINLSDNAGIYMPELDALRVLSCCPSRRRWVCGEYRQRFGEYPSRTLGLARH
ncbi:serine hydrolase [Cupriavidus basilensis]